MYQFIAHIISSLTPDYKNALYSEKTAYMLVCTIYILVGMAFTTTIIELVRYKKF
jgi:hypothetical protein